MTHDDYEVIESWIKAELAVCEKMDWQEPFKFGYGQALYAIMARVDNHKRISQPATR